MHDRSPCHRAKSTEEDITAQARFIFDWAVASPDLNPIENVWGLLKRAVNRRNPKDSNELRRCVLDEWEKLDNNIVIGLFNSMTRRVSKLLETQGKYTGY